MRVLPICLSAASMLSAAVAVAATPSTFVPAKDPTELEVRLGAIVRENGVPGMAFVIATRDGIVSTAGIGFADVAAAVRATPDTLFRVGSISKTVVGLAVLKLVEEGRLDLDAPVKRLVPDVAFTNPWEATDPVRVVHLLEHTTGWDENHPKEVAHSDPKPLTLAEGLALDPASRVSRWRPGTRYAYTSSGPAVAAAVIEKVTGTRFEDYVKQTFFDPIGMPTADYYHSAQTRALLTNLYHRDGRTPYPYTHCALRPSGALNASAREMGGYLLFFLRRGRADTRRLLTEASLQRMETPVTSYGAKGGLSVGCGLGNCMVFGHRGLPWRGHNGAIDGGLAGFSYRPEQGVGYFFAVNSASWKAFGEISRELTAYLTKDLPDPALPPAVAVSEELRDRYDGWYVPVNPRIEHLAWQDRMLGLRHLTVTEKGLALAMPFGPSWSLAAVGGGRFRPQNSSVTTDVLMNTPDGRIYVAFDSMFVQIRTGQAWAQIALMGLVALAMVSVPLFSLIWGARWISRRMRGVPMLHVRVLPLLAWLSGMAAVALVPDLIFAQEDGKTRFGHMTVWSVALAAATWAFAVFSIASLLAALRVWKRRRAMNRFAYYHSLAAAAVFVVAAAYLAWYGVIGYRSWA